VDGDGGQNSDCAVVPLAFDVIDRQWQQHVNNGTKGTMDERSDATVRWAGAGPQVVEVRAKVHAVVSANVASTVAYTVAIVHQACHCQQAKIFAMVALAGQRGHSDVLNQRHALDQRGALGWPVVDRATALSCLPLGFPLPSRAPLVVPLALAQPSSAQPTTSPSSLSSSISIAQSLPTSFPASLSAALARVTGSPTPSTARGHHDDGTNENSSVANCPDDHVQFRLVEVVQSTVGAPCAATHRGPPATSLRGLLRVVGAGRSVGEQVYATLGGGVRLRQPAELDATAATDSDGDTGLLSLAVAPSATTCKVVDPTRLVALATEEGEDVAYEWRGGDDKSPGSLVSPPLRVYVHVEEEEEALSRPTGEAAGATADWHDEDMPPLRLAHPVRVTVRVRCTLPTSHTVSPTLVLPLPHGHTVQSTVTRAGRLGSYLATPGADALRVSLYQLSGGSDVIVSMRVVPPSATAAAASAAADTTIGSSYGTPPSSPGQLGYRVPSTPAGDTPTSSTASTSLSLLRLPPSLGPLTVSYEMTRRQQCAPLAHPGQDRLSPASAHGRPVSLPLPLPSGLALKLVQAHSTLMVDVTVRGTTVVYLA